MGWDWNIELLSEVSLGVVDFLVLFQFYKVEMSWM